MVCGEAECDKVCGPSVPPREGKLHTVVYAMSLFAAVLIALIVMDLMTVVVAPTHITEEQCSMPIQNHGGYATVSCWLGFGFNSTLGYPGEGPPVGLETPLEAEVWLQLKCGCRCAPSILAAGWAHVLQWPDRQLFVCVDPPRKMLASLKGGQAVELLGRAIYSKIIRGTKIQMCTKHPRCRLGPCAAVARPAAVCVRVDPPRAKVGARWLNPAVAKYCTKWA